LLAKVSELLPETAKQMIALYRFCNSTSWWDSFCKVDE